MLHLTAWQMCAVVGSAAAAILGGRALGHWAHRALYRVALVAHAPSDDKIVLQLAAPLGLLAVVLVWEVFMAVFELPADVRDFTHTVSRIGVLAAVAWGAARALDAALEGFAVRSGHAARHQVAQAALPIVRRAGKVLVGLVAGAMILACLDFPISPLIVVVALAGFAASLAGHRSLENLFAAYQLVFDHAVREGDFVRLDTGLAGTIEAVGMYSTRIRTPDFTMVVVPNRKLADAQIETQLRPTRPHAAVPPPSAEQS